MIIFPPGKHTQPFCLFNKKNNKIVINYAQFPPINYIKKISRQLFTPSLHFVDCRTVPFSCSLCAHACMYTWVCIHNTYIPIPSLLPVTYVFKDTQIFWLLTSHELYAVQFEGTVQIIIFWETNHKWTLKICKWKIIDLLSFYSSLNVYLYLFSIYIWKVKMMYERSNTTLPDKCAMKQKWWCGEALKYEFKFSLVLEVEWLYFIALGSFNKTDALTRTMPASLLFPDVISITSKEEEFVRKQKKENRRIYGILLSSVIN